MKRRLDVVIVLLVAMSWSGQPAAHHAFAAEFDANKPIKVKGTLTKMEWVNPHGWLHVDVKDESGRVTSWAIETGSPNSLLRRGLRKTDFAIGAEVSIDGFRSKSSATTVNAVSVKLSDGRDFFVGSSGTGAPEPKAGGAGAER